MEEPPLPKGMRPIEGYIMHNFLYWLAMYHPEITGLHLLSFDDLLHLARQFENSRPDIDPSPDQDWTSGFEKLFSDEPSQDDYQEAREALERRQ
jgi:hypothetical protein